MASSQWVKNIPFERCPILATYDNINHFHKVADIVTDEDLNKKGTKARQTVIKAVPTISTQEFGAKATEWLYMLVINGHIVKIGGTRDGLKNRFGSYLCGHHTPDRGGSGKCSVTNAFIYNTLDHHLRLGHAVEMYGYKLPGAIVTQNILGEDVTFSVQTFHKYESKFLQAFAATYGSMPFLSDNADPEYKKQPRLDPDQSAQTDPDPPASPESAEGS